MAISSNESSNNTEDGTGVAPEILLLRSVNGRKLGRGLLPSEPACQLSVVDHLGRSLFHQILPANRKTRNPQWELNQRIRVDPSHSLQLRFFDCSRSNSELGTVVVRLELFRQSRSHLEVPLVPRGRVYLSAHLGAPDIESSSGRSLPPGWEERSDGNGRTFYVDHNRQRTQWEPPEGVLIGGVQREEEQEESRRQLLCYRQRSAAAHAAAAVAPPDADRLLDALQAIDDGMRANFEGEQSGQNGTENEEEEERSLPEGWSSQMAPNGRVFYIDHNNRRTQWDDPRVSNGSGVGGASDGLPPLPSGWEQRVSADGKVFFVDHNHQRTQWEDPRFESAASSPSTPYSAHFKQKVEFFRSKLPPAPNGKCELIVNRTSIFEDSYRQIMAREPEQLRQKLWIELVGENALDYGGVSREWCLLLSRHCFNPYYGLFEYSATDTYTLQINSHSGTCNPEHLSYFHFIGRIIGMALYHSKLLDAFFIRPFHKMMLGAPLSMEDMESVDTAFYQSLLFVKEHDPEGLDLTFSVDEDAYGKMESIELMPGGAELAVTEENKDKYIEAVVQWRFSQRIRSQMDALLKGVYELVPVELLRLFDASELELLLCGLQAIDVTDWRLNTLYKGGYGPNHPVIYNFWKCMLGLDNGQRARVLQFVTGTSRVPMNGFSELFGSTGPQKFTIEKWGDDRMLPRAHTCFNRLDLPPYRTFADLRKKLLIAIENSEIFAGVD